MRHDSYHFVACAQTCADGVVQTGVIQSKRSKPSEILRKSNGKLCCDGHFDYTLINLKSGRAAPIPASIAQKYAI